MNKISSSSALPRTTLSASAGPALTPEMAERVRELLEVFCALLAAIFPFPSVIDRKMAPIWAWLDRAQVAPAALVAAPVVVVPWVLYQEAEQTLGEDVACAKRLRQVWVEADAVTMPMDGVVVEVAYRPPDIAKKCLWRRRIFTPILLLYRNNNAYG